MATVTSRPNAVLGQHETLGYLLAHARDSAAAMDDPRHPMALADAFVSVLSRHVAAVEDVVYPEARRRLHDRGGLIDEQVRVCRDLEHAMRAIYAEFYGDAFAPDTGLDRVWAWTARLLADHDTGERLLFTRLDTVLSDADRHALDERFHHALRWAPTRPHPYSSHARMLGRLHHRLLAVVDRAMDAMDNRIIPSPPHLLHGRPDSRLTTYLTGTHGGRSSTFHR